MQTTSLQRENLVYNTRVRDRLLPHEPRYLACLPLQPWKHVSQRYLMSCVQVCILGATCRYLHCCTVASKESCIRRLEGFSSHFFLLAGRQSRACSQNFRIPRKRQKGTTPPEGPFLGLPETFTLTLVRSRLVEFFSSQPVPAAECNPLFSSDRHAILSCHRSGSGRAGLILVLNSQHKYPSRKSQVTLATRMYKTCRCMHLHMS